jgi:hypothetical protein
MDKDFWALWRKRRKQGAYSAFRRELISGYLMPVVVRIDKKKHIKRSLDKLGMTAL